MTWVAIAVAGVGLVGAAVSADAAGDAADAQSESNAASRDESQRQFDLQRADNERFFYEQMDYEAQIAAENRAAMEAMDARNRADKEQSYQRVRGDNLGAINRGETAGNQLQYLMGLGDNGTGEKGYLTRQFTEADMTKDGGYDFRMGEGQKSVGNQFAASGNLLSGAAMKALTRFNQDFASNEYNNAYGRFNNDQTNQYNRLAGIQGAGQNAVNSVAGNSGVVQGTAYQQPASNTASQFAGLNASNNASYGNALSQYQQNQGNINANLSMARGNAFNQGLSGLNSAWNTYQSQQQTPNTTTPIYAGGWGTGNTYGNQDYGAYF